MVQKVEWDSDFFGFPIGQCFFNEVNAEFNEEKFIQDSLSYRLVYLFSSTSIYSSLFKLVDEKLVFKKKIEKRELVDSTVVFFDANLHSKSDLLNLVYLSGKYSRFNTDINFENSEFQKLYAKWINNSLQNVTNPQIIVKFIDGKLAGFISFSLNNQDAKIELIAVDEHFQGKGIGSELIKNVEFIAQCHFCQNLEVITQGLNSSAIHLYEKNNFICINKTYIYHYWKR